MKGLAGVILFCLAAAIDRQAPVQSAMGDVFGRWSRNGARIVFTSDRTGDPEIYVMSADGTGLTRLTDVPGRDAHPDLSPDGRQIVFQSPRAGDGTHIFVMDAEGSGLRQVTSMPGFSGVPVWSPDGSRLAFQRAERLREAPWHLYLVSPDGSGLTQLTSGASNDQVPQWSGDGRRLLFYSDRTGRNQLYELDVASREIRALHRSEDDDTSAAWSPDERQVVFACLCGRGDARCTCSSGPPARSANWPTFPAHQPSFSPDGRRVLFHANADGRGRLHVVSRDGSDLRRLSPAAFANINPSWSPDGTRLLFQSERTGGTDIYVVQADGSSVTRVTNHPGRIHARPGRPTVSASYSIPSATARGTSTWQTPTAPTCAAWRPGGIPTGRPTGAASCTTPIATATRTSTSRTWRVRQKRASRGVRGETATRGGRRMARDIAFGTGRDGNSEVYVMAADGANPRNLTRNPAQDAGAAWAPDGGRLTFFTTRDGNEELSLMNRDGSAPVNLTRNPDIVFESAWSPDGRQIAFYSSREGDFDIYVMRPDGSAVRRLTGTRIP